MNYAYIDSASLMSAVGGIASRPDYDNWDDWTRQSIYDITMLSINNFLTIAPSPQSHGSQDSHPAGTLYSCYDKALDKLKNISEDLTPATNKNANEKKAHAEFKNWLNACMYNDDISDIIKRTKKEISYNEWIEWAVRDAWVDHCRRQYDGLFNRDQISILSLVLKVSRDELENIRVKTKKETHLIEKWSKDKDRDSEFELARDAYVASAILRGRFHEEISKANDRSFQFHPIRKHVLPPLKNSIQYSIPEPLKYLISIIVTAPYEESHPMDRISLWAENIVKVRDAYRLKRLDLRLLRYQKINGDEALKIAINTAKELKFRIYVKCKEDIIDDMLIISKSCAGPVLNFPWLDAIDAVKNASDEIPNIVSIASDVGMRHIEKEKSLGTRIMEGRTLKEIPLCKLAKAQAGRIVHSPQGLEF